jgi:alpha-beta hydrolase superfamily lysophospholipase
MLGQSRADWDPFARALQQRGFAVLTVDLRGQGESSGPVDWAKAPADVQAVWQALTARPEVAANHSGIVGASIGANLALMIGAKDSNVATVIALSPGQDYMGLQPAAQLGNFGQRGVLFVASQDDAYSYDSVRQMASLAPKGETYYFATAGHGLDMFSQPNLEPVLFSWLEDHLGMLKG